MTGRKCSTSPCNKNMTCHPHAYRYVTLDWHSTNWDYRAKASTTTPMGTPITQRPLSTWCMEDMVEYGLRPQYLSYMLRASLLNGEQVLARKYARQLNAHPFYQIDTELDYKAECKAIEPLLEYNNILDGDGGHVEAYLLQNYATMRGGTRQMVTLSLDCALILKDINDFWPLFIKMLPVWEHENGNKIPRHYQEAALLFANLQGNIDLSQVNIDADIKERFDNQKCD